MFEPKNIYSSLTPIYYITKIMGFAPFKLMGKHSKGYAIAHVSWSVFLIIVFGVYAIFSVNTTPSDDTLVLKITDAINIHLCIFSMCGGIFFACFFRHSISSIIQDLCAIDKEFYVIKFDIKGSYRRTKVYSMICACIIFLNIVGILVNNFLRNLNQTNFLITVGLTLAYSAPLFPGLALAQFCTLVLILRKRFMWINEEMKHMGSYATTKILYEHLDFYRDYNSNSSSVENERLLNTVLEFGEKHHKLCTISKKLNKAYSVQILLFMMQAFLMLVSVSFFLIKMYYSRELHQISIQEKVYYSNMLIFHIILLLIITLICASTAKEARKAGTILHNVVPISAFSNGSSLDLGAACFSLQLLHHNVKFTACRLFPIDETLLYTIVGAATTYLVIVLQFEFGVSGAKNQECNDTLTTIMTTTT